MNTYPTTTDRCAKSEGYAAITRPYSLRSETQIRMLNNVIQDMQGCDYRLVEEVGGIAVYRKKSEINLIEE